MNKSNLNTKVSIVGFGRFGKTLYRLIKDDFQLVIYDTDSRVFDGFKLSLNSKITQDLNEVYLSDVCFFAVPISKFEEVICSHKVYFKDDQLLIDVLSVKIHPKNISINY